MHIPGKRYTSNFCGPQVQVAGPVPWHSSGAAELSNALMTGERIRLHTGCLAHVSVPQASPQGTAPHRAVSSPILNTGLVGITTPNKRDPAPSEENKS